MKAIWKDQVIAESDNTIEVEGNHYFPSVSVKDEYLEKTDHHTVCPWKGEASYYNIKVDGEVNENAAWNYPEPKEEAVRLKDYIAFWKDVKVTD